MDSDTAGLEPSEAAKRKIKKANKALNEGKHEQGIVFLSDAIELCPNNAEYVLKRGTALLNQKMYKEAMKDAILCRTLEPENIASSILLAKCHRAYGNFVIAENVLQLASSHDSTNKIEPLLRSLKNLRVDALRILELNLERKFTDANSLCNQLLSVAPECYTAKLIKCLSLTMMGQHGEAGKLVDSLLEVNPCDYEALFAKAQLMYYAEKYDEANVMLEQILVRPLPQVGDSAKAVLECIVNFIHAKDFAQTAVEKKDYETAIKRYEDALKIDVKHNLGNGKIHLILSMIHTRQRNLFKALDHCELSIQLDPMNEKAITKRIDLLEKLTFIDEAIEQTKKFYASLQSDDQSEIVRLEAEQSLSRSQGHYFVLSIIPSATDAEISAAYNKKLNYFASCERLIVVEDKMKLKRKEVDRAYAVLRDAKKRTLYDRQIGISRARQDSSGSDDELLAELRSVSTKTTMPVSMTQSMFTSIRLNDNGSKDKFVFVEKTTDSLVENEKDDSDKEEDFDDALTDSIEVVSDKEEAVADVQSPEVDHEPEMSPVEKEAQLKYSDGIQRFSEHDYLEAVQSFTDAIILCPTNPQYYVARSDAYLMIPKYAEVLDDAWKAVELDSASEKGYLRILACNLIFGHISQAEDIVGRLETLDQLTFKQWSDHLSKFKETVKVANDQLASFNYEETIKRCNEVLEKSPEFVQMKLLKAEALTRSNNLQLAENIVDDLIDKDEAQSDVLYIRGLLAYYKDDLDVSLKILSDVQTKYPKHLKSKTQAVKIELLKGKKEEGNEAFKAARYDEACAKYTEGLSIDRNNKLTNAKLYLNRAKAKLNLGHTADARMDCDQAITLDPKYVNAYVKRAEIHTRLAMYDEAVADWETVCETNSSASNKSYLENARKLMNGVKREPFAILGISATAPADQIKQARNRLALIHHPDKHETEAAPIRRMHERKFKAVQEAFNAMMNCEAKATEPKMRESYYYPREEPKAEANKPPVYGDDCQVYVTGFDDELTEAELEKKMADHGRVISVKIRSVVKSRRYAFVTFAKAENALKVQSKLISFNGMKLTIRPKRATANDDTRSETSDHGYESKPRHDSGVDYSDDPMVSRGSRVQYRDYPNDHHVWIGLGSRGQHITEADLKTTLGQFGPLVGVSLKELQTGVKFAFATFAKASDARKALNRQVMCKGVPLRIEKKTEPNSRTAGGDRTFTSSRFDFDDHDIGEEW